MCICNGDRESFVFISVIFSNLTGAPWVSQAANRRIIQAAKNVIEVDRIENLIGVIM